MARNKVKGKPEITVLFISHYAKMYGANQSMCTLMLQLRRDYNINPIVLLPRDGEIVKYLEEYNIPYYIQHYYWWVNSDKGFFQIGLNLRKQLLNKINLGALQKLISNEKIDLLYSNSITINIGALLSKRMQLPHIWHLRESMEQFGFKYSIGIQLTKLFLKKSANKFILISDYLIKSYSAILPKHKIEKVYNGISIEESDVIKTNFNGVLNICVLGVLSEQKNQLDALRAIQYLKQKGHKKFRLHFIGAAKGEYLEQINKYISHNNLFEDVLLHGHQSNVHSLLNSMDLALMTSRDEAFGRVSIEYMLHGIPVIASKSGANEEIIQEGVNGVLYELYNHEELAEKIEVFIQDSKSLEKLGNEAMKYAKNNFSASENAKKVYNVIWDVLNEKATI